MNEQVYRQPRRLEWQRGRQEGRPVRKRTRENLGTPLARKTTARFQVSPRPLILKIATVPPHA